MSSLLRSSVGSEGSKEATGPGSVENPEQERAERKMAVNQEISTEWVYTSALAFGLWPLAIRLRRSGTLLYLGPAYEDALGLSGSVWERSGAGYQHIY